MRHGRFPLILSLVTGLSLFGSLPRAHAADSGIRIPSVTRWVHSFAELEKKLNVAMRTHDAQRLGLFLARGFEQRIAGEPGIPIPRADWLRQVLAEPDRNFGLADMAVHAYGKLAIVSYTWTLWPAKQTQAPKKQRIFVVDSWRREHDGWKLAVRYAAPVGDLTERVPGGNPPHPLFEKRK